MRAWLTTTYGYLTGRIPMDLYQQIAAALSYSRQTYAWNPRVYRKTWSSERVTLADQVLVPRDGPAVRFPAGLWHRIAPLVPVTPTRPQLLPLPAQPVRVLADGTALFPDQQEALRIAVTHQRGLLNLATNFGKTPLMAAILATWPGLRGIVLLDQKGLVQQLARELERFLREPIGVFGGGIRTRTRGREGPRCTVATVQTLHHHRGDVAVAQWLFSQHMVLADEVHRVSPMWLEALAAIPADVRLGLSGTVEEVKYKLPMEAFFGPVLHTVEDHTLIQQGRSASTVALMPYFGHQTTLTSETDYDVLYEHLLAGSHGRNALLASFTAEAVRLGCPTLVYFYRLKHGRALERLIRAFNPAAHLVRLDGESAPAAVEAGLKDAADGRPGAYLLGTGFTQGVDLPGVRVLVNAAGWRSPVATSQRGGRVLRRKPTGAQWAVVVDPMDLGQSTVKNQANARKAVYRKKGFQVVEGTAAALLEQLSAFVLKNR